MKRLPSWRSPPSANAHLILTCAGVRDLATRPPHCLSSPPTSDALLSPEIEYVATLASSPRPRAESHRLIAVIFRPLVAILQIYLISLRIHESWHEPRSNGSAGGILGEVLPSVVRVKCACLQVIRVRECGWRVPCANDWCLLGDLTR